jgi:hypothetical protein
MPSLRYDAFQSHFAGVLENRFAIAIQVFRELHPVSPRQYFF